MKITHIEIQHGTFEVAMVRASIGKTVIIIPDDIKAKIEALAEPLVH